MGVSHVKAAPPYPAVLPLNTKLMMVRANSSHLNCRLLVQLQAAILEALLRHREDNMVPLQHKVNMVNLQHKEVAVQDMCVLLSHRNISDCD